MNNIKEINGRYYQECEIIMLVTDKKATGIIKFGNQLRTTSEGLSSMVYYSQHLYFLSNEEIKKGDWYLNIVSNEIVNVDFNIDYEQNHCKKIIATTDISLQLPQPSKEFIQAYIQAYNKGKPITKVLVEMEEIDSQDYHAEIDYFGKTDIELEYELKINSSNEITIKKIKDNYTREEVIELLSKHFVKAGSKIGLGQNVTEFTKIWIEENL